MKLRRIIVLCIALALCLCAFAGCGSESTPEKSGKPVVAVSIVPEETFVREVCGDLAEVVVMVPPGYSPEHYEPSPQQIARLQDAEVYFSIGLSVEDSAVLPMLSPKTSLIALDEICADTYDELEIDGGRDPHIWLSPKRAAVMVKAIASKMAQLDPPNAEIYASNASAYVGALDACDKDIMEIFEFSPRRDFIVFHPAYGYFADDFALTQHALEEGGKEATAARMQELADFAAENAIEVIFYQAQADSGQAKAFADEIGGRAIMLDPLSGDYIPNLVYMAKEIAEVLK